MHRQGWETRKSRTIFPFACLSDLSCPRGRQRTLGKTKVFRLKTKDSRGPGSSLPVSPTPSQPHEWLHPPLLRPSLAPVHFPRDQSGPPPARPLLPVGALGDGHLLVWGGPNLVLSPYLPSGPSRLLFPPGASLPTSVLGLSTMHASPSSCTPWAVLIPRSLCGVQGCTCSYSNSGCAKSAPHPRRPSRHTGKCKQISMDWVGREGRMMVIYEIWKRLQDVGKGFKRYDLLFVKGQLWCEESKMIKSQFLSISMLQLSSSKAMSSEPWGQKTFWSIPLLKKEMKGCTINTNGSSGSS